MSTERRSKPAKVARATTPPASGVLALTPATLVIVVETAAIIYAALGGTLPLVYDCVFALLAGAIAGVLAPIAIAITRQKDPLLWCVISIAATSVALMIGFTIWGQAAKIACHGAIDCPLG
jgi:hypothetical protein